MRRVVVLLVVPGVALAVPVEFEHQGRVIDSLGTPISGSHNVTVALCDGPTSSNCPVSETKTLQLDDGYYSIRVGDGGGLDHSQLDGLDWVEVRVDGAPLLPRTELGDTPRAAIALTVADGSVDSAAVADGSLVAADVDASQIQRRVDGTCSVGQAITSIGTDGSVTCASAGSQGEIIKKVGLGAPTTSDFSTRRYIVEATPAHVGRVIPIDVATMDALCRDDDGCTISLSMVNWDLSLPGLVASTGYHVFGSQTSDWYRLESNGTQYLDDDNSVSGWSAWDCFMTDAETWTGSSNGRVDSARGWGLLNAAGGSYSDATVTCRIIIRD